MSMTQGSLENWAFGLAAEASSATSLTVGLANGSRHANDRRILDKMAAETASAIKQRKIQLRMLVLRLDFDQNRTAETKPQAAHIPAAKRSPLGEWFEVTLQVSNGRKTAGELEPLAQWLPAWKIDYPLILIDLGPLDQLASRTLGRLCDSNYLILGPDTCASQEWIHQNLAKHFQAGSTICGSVVASFAKAA